MTNTITTEALDTISDLLNELHRPTFLLIVEDDAPATMITDSVKRHLAGTNTHVLHLHTVGTENELSVEALCHRVVLDWHNAGERTVIVARKSDVVSHKRGSVLRYLSLRATSSDLHILNELN